jgi:hypothetical protein
MEGVKSWLCSQAADFTNTGIQKTLFSDTTTASIPVVTMLRNNLSIYVFLYIIFFLIAPYVNSFLSE